MTNILYKSIEKQIKMAAVQVQNEIKRLENVHRFSFSINVEGRTDGDLKIEYRIGTDYDSSVGGGDITNVLLEAMRRKGWNDANAPKMISHVTLEEVKED